jgi:hypothetical protein
LTGQWHHLHQSSLGVMACAHAGHWPVASVDGLCVAGRLTRGPALVGFDGLAARDLRRGAPGRRRLQCGQYSDASTKLFRHSGQETVATCAAYQLSEVERATAHSQHRQLRALCLIARYLDDLSGDSHVGAQAHRAHRSR